jgi:hypothetical protein
MNAHFKPVLDKQKIKSSGLSPGEEERILKKEADKRPSLEENGLR